MATTALILVDIQNDYFVDGRWPVAKMDAVAENASKLLADARGKGMPIFHIRHEIPSDQAPFFRPGSEGAQIHASVAPQGDEPVFLKNKPNSFRGTELKAALDAAGVTDTVICGAMSQMCIDATARAAADFGYAVTVVEDACGAKEQSFDGVDVPAAQVHAAIMAPLGMSYGKVVSTEAYLAG